MRTHFQRLDALGVNYAKSYYDLNAVYANGRVTLKCLDKSVQIRYTLDGSEPNANANLYMAPVTVTKTTAIKAAAFVQDKPVGKTLSAVYSIHKATGKPYTLSTQPERYSARPAGLNFPGPTRS